jgi:1-deoxy-D-xylulose-5-phosphate synthase
MPEWKTPFREISIGKGRKLKEGRELAILSFGHPGNFVTAAIRSLRTEDIDPAHYDMRFAKPLDEELLHEIFQQYNKIITVEDGSITGGFGAAVLEFMAAHQYQAQVIMLGIPDEVIEHGTLKQLQHECGFDAEAIYATAKSLYAERIPPPVSR